MQSERTLLLTMNMKNVHINRTGLSVLFSVICVVDVFGVFPLITLPKAIIDCGCYGIIVLIIVCSIQMYTAILLGRCWIMAESLFPTIHGKNRYPYSALAEVTYGYGFSKFVTFLLDLSIFGGGIPNLIVASQNLQLLGLRLSDDNFNISFCYWIIILGTIMCPILWFGSPKDMKLICTISVIIVVLVFLLLCGCLIFSDTVKNETENTDNIEDSSFWHKIFTAYGIIAFQFDIHPTILTIQMDMKEQHKLFKVVFGGFAATLFMFGSTLVLIVIKYGTFVHASILQTLPTSVALHFAVILASLQLCLTSAISNSALYQHMEDCFNISRTFNRNRCILRTILTLLAVAIAESVPKFDLVMSLIGGTLTGPLVFLLPPLFYIKMKSLQSKHDKQLVLDSFTNIVYSTNENCPENVSKSKQLEFHEDQPSNTSYINWNKNIELSVCVSIFVLSSIITSITTYLNVTQAVFYANFTQPCIFNLSNA